MAVREMVVDTLVVLGVGVEAMAAVGVLRMKDALDRLHFAGAATTGGPVLLALAVIVSGASRTGCIRAVLIALALLVTGPVLGHATARMTMHRRRELEKRKADPCSDDRPGDDGEERHRR